MLAVKRHIDDANVFQSVVFRFWALADLCKKGHLQEWLHEVENNRQEISEAAVHALPKRH